MGSTEQSFRQRELLRALQLELFPTDASSSAEADVNRVETSPVAVECPVGCRGTTNCLCGQQELSDNPLWIEENIFPDSAQLTPQPPRQ